VDEFEKFKEQAIECIQSGRFDEAAQYIESLASLNMSSPQPHNLYGILLEYTGDRRRALKHYRAANDLDPTYRPAKSNLYRAGQFTYEIKGCDFG
jgi:Flp pilus assembly protein TadD